MSTMLDTVSSMPDTSTDLTLRIAARVKALRETLGLSLEALSAASGVSRSMLSLIERAETSPTAVVLQRLAAGLGVTLAALFDPPVADDADAQGPIARRARQTEWRDPASGYRRRNVSPTDHKYPSSIVDVHFPAGERVAFEPTRRDGRYAQYVWVLSGTMRVTVGREQHELQLGDCLAMSLDEPVVFHNPGSKAARYAVVLMHNMPTRRQ
jgi:transcriptional regulator with XRE-family HTH domain